MLPPTRNPLRRRLRRWFYWGLAVVLVGGVLVLAHRPLLVGFATSFRVDDPAPSDAIVLLLGGTDHRPAKVAELYRRHLAQRVLMAGARPRPVLSRDETAENQKVMIRAGVPQEAIQILPGIATSTRDEALLVRDYVRSDPSIRRIVVVTSAFHTARARWIFRKVLRDSGVEVRTAAVDHPDFNETNWYTRDESLVVYFSEALKSVYYRLAY